MARYAKLTVVCGRRQTGKTNKTLTTLYRAVSERQRKVLIFDPTDEFGSYIYRPGEPPHTIKAIFIKDIPRFTAQTPAEIVRIRPFLDNSVRMTTDDMAKVLAIILNTYRNGILLIEDINKYISDNTPNDIMGSLATLRQANVDLIAHYQLIGKAGNPKILGMTNYIRMHRTMDQVSRHTDKFLDKTEILSISENIVNARYKYGVKNDVNDATGKYFSTTVDMEDFKINGIFTQPEAESAVAEYISGNSRDTVKKLMNQLDRNGRKVWKDYASSYQYLERNMMQDYFTFK